MRAGAPENGVLGWTPSHPEEEQADDAELFDCRCVEETSPLGPLLQTAEINSAEMNSVEKQKYDRVGISMDSGAGAPVANPEDFPGYVVTDLPGSLAGQIVVEPGSEKIPN